jgi:serine/threonine-protein kinase
MTAPMTPSPGGPAPRLGVPAPGELVGGKYRCERVLGEGGMGVVLAARHVELDQGVAVKVMLPEALKAPAARERFLREARSALQIRSEHVARVLDFGTLESGCPYLVMEMLEGTDLKHRIEADGPLGVEEAVELVMQACEALAEAHLRGVIHRDLKPANLFVTRRADGTPLVKVLDFGISKTGQGSAPEVGPAGLTSTNAILGTPTHMSPEQLRSAKSVDGRTDVWSLGVTLYELVAGRLPFEGESVAVVCSRILTEPPRPIREHRPDVPVALAKALERCLDKDPAGRFQSIAELAEALRVFGPESCAVSARRIVRMSRTDAVSGPAASLPRGSGSSRGEPRTASAWGRTTARPHRKAAAFALGAVGIVAVVASSAWLLSRRDGGIGAGRAAAGVDTAAASIGSAGPSTSSSAGQNPFAPPAVSSAAGDVATGHSSAPVVALPPLASSPGGAASAAATASATAPSTRQPAAAAPPATVVPPKSRAQPPATSSAACPAGEELTSGHCCARGMVWQADKCTRPLAKDVPY